MDREKVRFDPAAIARYSTKVEVDPRYRANAETSHTKKRRPILDDLTTGTSKKEEKETRTTNTKPSQATQKRTFTEIETPHKSTDSLFSLPSFKKQKTTPDQQAKPKDKKPITPVNSTIKSYPPAKQALSHITKSAPQIQTTKPTLQSKGTLTPKSTTLKSPVASAQQKNNTAKPSYASVTSKPAISKSLPTTLAKPLASNSTSKPSASTLKPLTKPLASLASKPLNSKPLTTTSKPLAFKPRPLNKPPTTTSKQVPPSVSNKPATKSTIPSTNSKPSTITRPGQAPIRPNGTTLQTLSNKNPLSQRPLAKPQNGLNPKLRVERNEYELDPIADGELLGEEERFWNNNYSSAIQNLFKRKHKYPPIQYSDDEGDVKETGFLDWEEEEQRSEEFGRREDKTEFLREKKRKMQKQQSKIK